MNIEATNIKKVLIITYYWPPSGGAGVQRWMKFAKYLSRMDVETHVLTVDPEYATYPQIDKSLSKEIPQSVKVYYTKTFEPYSFYKKVSSNKEAPYGGFVNTKKLDFKEKTLRFIRGNFFLPDPRRGWNKYAFKKAKEVIYKHNIDTIITTGPPQSTQLVGLSLKQKLNIKWISDFRDPWTDIYYYKQLYPTQIATYFNKKLEKKVISLADKIITVSFDFKILLASKVSGSDSKIEVISNGFDSDDFKDVKAYIHPELFYISHIGTIAKNYNIQGLVNAIQQLPKEIKAKTRIRFIGKVASEIIELFQQAGLENIIEIIEYVPHKKAVEYMFSSDILLLIIPEVDNNKGIVPGKLFEYMASNTPILALASEQGDVARIIEETRCGLVSDYDDNKKIETFLSPLLQSKENTTSNRTDETKSSKYSRKYLTERLIKIIDQLK